MSVVKDENSTVRRLKNRSRQLYEEGKWEPSDVAYVMDVLAVLLETLLKGSQE